MTMRIQTIKLKLLMATVGMAMSSMVAHADEPLTTLTNQTYALCAGAISFVFDQVAYANCQILLGTSISLTLSYPPVSATGQPGGNIETVNQQGAAWKSFIVSTYSPPASLTSPQGNTAIYTCPAGSTGSYAQCDGGICFRSTTNTTFPGLGPVSSQQIVCSCPIATPSASQQQQHQQQQHPAIGYQIFGPNPCLQGKDRYNLCNAPVQNGSTLYIGAPTGTAQASSRILNGGKPVKFNECLP
jgi:hypothetical protein